MKHYRHWLKLAFILCALPAARAEDHGCDYRLTPLDAKASEVELSVSCNDSAQLDHLTFPNSSIRSYVTLKEDGVDRHLYKLDLKAFADSQNDANVALRRGGSILISPDVLLPANERIGLLRFHIEDANGARHAAAYDKASDGAYLFTTRQLSQSGPFILGQFDSRDVPGENGTRFVLLEGQMRARPDQLYAWVVDLAKSNSRFWRKPPVPNALIVLTPNAGEGLSGGRVLGGSGAVVLMNVGRNTEPASLYDEWVGVHEFLHLGTPLSRDKGIWFNEGIATYFEPILRYRAGWKMEDEIWREWITDMPRGEPAISRLGLYPAGRRGAYWGGALFMLLADISLRRASNGNFGMEDCLKAVLQKTGGANRRGEMAMMLQLCDQAAGNRVVSELGRKHIDQGAEIDLTGIWKDLGIAMGADGKISYNENAPLSWVRKSIVNGQESLSGIPKTMPLN